MNYQIIRDLKTFQINWMYIFKVLLFLFYYKKKIIKLYNI